MPTVMTHAVAAAALGCLFSRPRRSWRLCAAGALCAMAPDLDVVAFAFRVPYGSLLGHRGLTHSILFAALVAAILARPLASTGSALRAGLYLFLATLSHPLLDALTNGGLGVALLAPVSDARFFFPARPIEVSPIGSGFFSSRGLSVLASEVVWVWVPSGIVAAVGLAASARADQSTEGHRP